MTTKKSKTASDLRAKLAEAQTKVKEATGKAKAASAKANGVIKANTQVVVESGKILSGGIKEIGAAYVADGRKAVVALADDANALSKVKSMPEFIRLQGEQAARKLESVQAANKRNREALRGLFSGKLAPMIKDRVKANLELFRKAA